MNPSIAAYLNGIQAQLQPRRDEAAERLAALERAETINELLAEVERHAAAHRPPTTAEVIEAELELARREEMCRVGLLP